MEKSFIKIDFTESGNFASFNDSVKSFLQKNRTCRNVQIIDYIYPLENLKNFTYEIKDHINLSGVNPLKGPQFIPLTNIYLSRKGILVCGLKRNIHPNSHEKKILHKANIKAYCYNLVQTVIFTASLGLKIKAKGIVKIIRN